MAALNLLNEKIYSWDKIGQISYFDLSGAIHWFVASQLAKVDKIYKPMTRGERNGHLTWDKSLAQGDY